ncbi:hypothetical protein, partial [Actinoplanes sp. NPDC051859]|uniref:hypothetical protein n=1 Tax=Actinoplanes sp. NPDC051859 TaxID=3363909 RepID=UPI00378F4E57
PRLAHTQPNETDLHIDALINIDSADRVSSSKAERGGHDATRGANPSQRDDPYPKRPIRVRRFAA